MRNKVFWLFFIAILAFSFVARILPVLDNNFHFTMDQGNDAVYVREIVQRGQIALRGPETNISGLYAGPLWYYFLAVGYIIFAGHPMAPVILLVVLSLITTAAIIWTVSKKISPAAGLILGASLQIFWWYYDISRYGFNPFPLVFLTLGSVFLLTNFWEKPKNQILWAAVLVGLSFHAEIAGASALTLFFLAVCLFFLTTRRLSIKKLLVTLFIIFLFFIPMIIDQWQNDLPALEIIKTEILSPRGVFAENRFQSVSVYFIRAISDSVIPENPPASLTVFIAVILFWLFTLKKKSFPFILKFACLATVFVGVSWVWFGLGTGWRVWHTVAIPPLIFITVILIILTLPRLPKTIFLSLIIISQAVFFRNLYLHFLAPIDDQSILKNELAAIDWVYQNADGQGFYVYNYLPSVRDYSHQYLFWWYGRKQYGYVPCEYAPYPGVPGFFVPGYQYYQEPKRPCANLRFLLIEPDTNTFIKNQWYESVSRRTNLLQSTTVGNITVEKRSLLVFILPNF